MQSFANLAHLVEPKLHAPATILSRKEQVAGLVLFYVLPT